MGDRVRARRERAAGWAAMRALLPEALRGWRRWTLLGVVVVGGVASGWLLAIAFGPDLEWRGVLAVPIGSVGGGLLVAATMTAFLSARARRRTRLDVRVMEENVVEHSIERKLTPHELDVAGRIAEHRRATSPLSFLATSLLFLAAPLLIASAMLLGVAWFSFAGLVVLAPVWVLLALGIVTALGRAELLVADRPG